MPIKYCNICLIYWRIRKAVMIVSKKIGFTLVEVMVSLMVIGVLAGVLIPVALHSRPDENVLKFKKGHETLVNAIGQLVRSDSFLSGDLGARPDGSVIGNLNSSQDKTYFCEKLADVLSVKSKNCSDKEKFGFRIRYDSRSVSYNDNKTLDDYCHETEIEATDPIGAEIVTSDGITYYQTSAAPFGISVVDIYTQSPAGKTPLVWCKENNAANNPQGITEEGLENYCNSRLYGEGGADENNFMVIYKMFCMDVDGINNGEPPFGYGIRTDGKMIFGPRTQQWLEKK